MSRRRDERPEDLNEGFEGRERLDDLLGKAGSYADTDDVSQAFIDAIRDGVPRSVVIDALFEEEPRFTSPKDARALYGNLFGLWALLEGGGSVAQPKAKIPRPPKPERAPKPQPWEGEAPDDAWVESAWKYLATAPESETRRFHDAFENRADALLTWLLEQNLSDEAHDAAQTLCFELFTLLELGGGAGAVPSALAGGGEVAEAELPTSFATWADECLFEAETDEESPWPPEVAQATRPVVGRALRLLWGQARLTRQKASR